MATLHETAYPRLKPDPTAKELDEIYTPSGGEVRLARSMATQPTTQLAVLIHLKMFQRLGYFVILADVPERIRQHIAQAAGLRRALSIRDLNRYDVSGAKRAHMARLRKFLRVRPLDVSGREWLATVAQAAAQTKHVIADIINVLLEELVHHRFELPGFSTLEKIAVQARASALAPAGAPALGPVTAPVTIVEFFDPACESCRAMYPHVKQLLAAHPKDVRLVIRYVPFHGQVSKEAIGVLEAAREQKKFEPVLETLMRNQPVWASHGSPDPKKVWDFAVAAGLDRARAQRYLATGAVETLIKREVAAVEAADIRGTPTFFVNGKLLSELGPQQLSALVAAELQRTRKKP